MQVLDTFFEVKMCKWGDTVLLYVPIPVYLSHTGQFHWDYKPVDKCVAPIVQALNDAGIYTASCCCGHGKRDGNIILHNGRILIVKANTWKQAKLDVEIYNLKLALSIISGRVTGLTADDYYLLGYENYEFGRPSWREIKERAEEIILEALLKKE